jgi:hypothetical protein
MLVSVTAAHKNRNTFGTGRTGIVAGQNGRFANRRYETRMEDEILL